MSQDIEYCINKYTDRLRKFVRVTTLEPLELDIFEGVRYVSPKDITEEEMFNLDPAYLIKCLDNRHIFIKVNDSEIIPVFLGDYIVEDIGDNQVTFCKVIGIHNFYQQYQIVNIERLMEAPTILSKKNSLLRKGKVPGTIVRDYPVGQERQYLINHYGGQVVATGMRDEDINLFARLSETSLYKYLITHKKIKMKKIIQVIVNCFNYLFTNTAYIEKLHEERDNNLVQNNKSLLVTITELRENKFLQHNDNVSINFVKMKAISIERIFDKEINTVVTIVGYQDNSNILHDYAFRVSDKKHEELVEEFNRVVKNATKRVRKPRTVKSVNPQLPL